MGWKMLHIGAKDFGVPDPPLQYWTAWIVLAWIDQFGGGFGGRTGLSNLDINFAKWIGFKHANLVFSNIWILEHQIISYFECLEEGWLLDIAQCRIKYHNPFFCLKFSGLGYFRDVSGEPKIK